MAAFWRRERKGESGKAPLVVVVVSAVSCSTRRKQQQQQKKRRSGEREEEKKTTPPTHNRQQRCGMGCHRFGVCSATNGAFGGDDDNGGSGRSVSPLRWEGKATPTAATPTAAIDEHTAVGDWTLPRCGMAAWRQHQTSGSSADEAMPRRGAQRGGGGINRPPLRGGRVLAAAVLPSGRWWRRRQNGRCRRRRRRSARRGGRGVGGVKPPRCVGGEGLSDWLVFGVVGWSPFCDSGDNND